MDEAVAQLADAFDARGDRLAVLKVARRSAESSGARRGAGEDEVARLERDAVADEGEDRRHVEDHLGRVVLLQQLAVHLGVDAVSGGIAELIGRDEPRPERGEGVERLAPRPLHVAELHIARGDVVGDRVGGR